MKKTKLKFAAAVAALAMTFAFVTSCGNASDVVDEIVNGGGDDSGNSDAGDKDGAEEEEKETVVDAEPSTALDAVKAAYNFAYIFQVKGETNYFTYESITEKNISSYDTLELKVAIFDSDGKEITNEYGKLNIKAQDSDGKDLADFGWNNAMLGGKSASYIDVALAEGATDAAVKQLLFSTGDGVTYVGIISSSWKEKSNDVYATKMITCVKQSWGASGSVDINLPEEITVAVGEKYTIKGKITFGEASAGTPTNLFIQDCLNYSLACSGSPDAYNMISDYTNGLSGTTKSFETTWTVIEEAHEGYGTGTQAGTHSKLQFCLGWKNEDAADGATCEIKIVEFSIEKQ